MNLSSGTEGAAWWDKESILLGLTKNPVTLLLLLPIVTFLFLYLISWTASPLRKFPGPPLACELNTPPTLQDHHTSLPYQGRES